MTFSTFFFSFCFTSLFRSLSPSLPKAIVPNTEPASDDLAVATIHSRRCCRRRRNDPHSRRSRRRDDPHSRRSHRRDDPHSRPSPHRDDPIRDEPHSRRSRRRDDPHSRRSHRIVRRRCQIVRHTCCFCLLIVTFARRRRIYRRRICSPSLLKLAVVIEARRHR